MRWKALVRWLRPFFFFFFGLTLPNCRNKSGSAQPPLISTTSSAAAWLLNSSVFHEKEYFTRHIFQLFFSLFHKSWCCLLSKRSCSLSCSYTPNFLQNFTDQWLAFLTSEVPTFILVANFVIRYHPRFRHSST